MRFEEKVALGRFLEDYPGMRVQPSSSTTLKLEGDFTFEASREKGPTIEDVYRLALEVPRRFPKAVPVVTELGGRIPRDPDHHVNADGSLCLGSPARLLVLISEEPTLPGFAARCIVPFVYAASYRAQHGGPLPFGELPHGPAGELHDYMELLGLESTAQVMDALKLLGMKKRKANKHPCPCGCGKRLGVCPYNKTIRRLRDQAGRPQFRSIRENLLRQLRH